MKILLVNDYGTPTGGAELLNIGWRDGLKKKGHDARLFASSARPLGAENLADYECFGTLSSFRILLQTLNPWAWLKLRKVLTEFQPDVVHVTIALTQLSPLIFPLLKNVPAVYNAQWYRSICPVGTKILPNGASCQFSMGTVCYRHNCLPLQDWLLLTVQKFFIGRWFNVFDKIVAASEAVKQRLSTAGMESVDVIWNGIPTSQNRPPLTSPPTVVFAGRLVWEKGVDILIEAFAKVQQQIPEAKLLIAGDGLERNSLESQVNKLKIKSHVSFLGHIDRTTLESVFAQAWVQVIPSRWAEPFGLVAAEAQMRGTAVIASNSGGLAEIVSHGKTGFLVPPNNADVLAEHLLTILQDKQLAEKLGKLGRKIAIENFSEDACVNKFIDLYEQLLNHKNRYQVSWSPEQIESVANQIN
ncbi:MAG: glycosyltransferase family 4 protein [Cyanobacteria bacterium P01_D01_bin.50]